LGEAKNKQGEFVKGKFKINVFSNGYKEIIFDSKAQSNIGLDCFNSKGKNNKFILNGKNKKKTEFKANLYLFHIGKVLKFSINNFEVNQGKFKKGEKEFFYFIDNINLGKLRFDPNFKLNGKNFHIHPCSYGRLSKTLQKYGGRQITSVICFKDTSSYFYKKDKSLFKLLTLLSFYNANYLSLFKIEIKQDTVIKEVYFDDKTYPFSNGYGTLDFTFVPLCKTIESTFPKFESKCNEIYGFADLIEIYLESLTVTIVENKFALIAVLFEGLKSRYVNSGLVDEFKKDKNNIYVKKNGKKIKKSFKELLVDIFTLEKFRHSKKELESLKDIRNLVIHEATARSTKRKITFHNTLKTYYDSLRMFERFMLKIVGYKGQYLNKTHNKGFIWKNYK
jgi:hypothetical protein